MSEENDSNQEEAPVVETPVKEEEPLKNFLEDRRIKVVPVQAGGRWAELLMQGEERKNEPYLFNKVKRSYQVPLRPVDQGGGLHRVLDNFKPFKTVQYPNETLTEQQYFEKVLGVDLNPLLPAETNFWRTDKRSRVVMDKKGIVLNLMNEMDMLKYKILLTNKKKIAPSPELQDRRATYQFMLLDENAMVMQNAIEADLKSNAAIKYAEISQSEQTMLDFFKVLGKGTPVKVDANWLKAEIFKLVEFDPKLFLSYANDPYYRDKIRIHDGVQLGVLKKIKENLYALDNGFEIGSMNDVISYLNNPENESIKARIQHLKEASKG